LDQSGDVKEFLSEPAVKQVQDRQSGGWRPDVCWRKVDVDPTRLAEDLRFDGKGLSDDER